MKKIRIKDKEKRAGILKIGKIDLIDCILPDAIDFSNPTCLYMDNYYYSGVIVVNYPKRKNIGWLSPVFSLDFNVDVSMFYEKLESIKVIKEITYQIGNMSGAIKTVSANQQDIDVIKNSYEDAKYIREQIQVNKEELYYLCIYFIVYSDNREELKMNLERLEGACSSMGLQTRRAVFRQEQILKSVLPICDNSQDIKESAARNVLTEALSSTYPFISSELYDREGILIGQNIQNRSLIVIDRFNTDLYKNANMCVLGTSGAGKSFFVKLMILRNRYIGISQFIIDPDGEYFKLCRELNGEYISIGGTSGKYINVMDIRENIFDAGETGYLAEKIRKLKVFFSLIFNNINEEEEVLLEEKIIECYFKKGITFDDLSLFEKTTDVLSVKKKFKSLKSMPVLEDLYLILERDESTKKLSVLLKPFVSGAFAFFNNYTNVDLTRSLIVADIHKLDEKILPVGMYLAIDAFWDRIKQRRAEKKIIYMDEIWRLIGGTGNLYTAEFVYKIFKTIRKFGGGATAITQDVSDFFAFENGKYGRAVVNNSALKFLLQLEEDDCNILRSILSLSEEEEMKVKSFNRGTGLLLAGKNHVIAKIEANDTEYNLITTDRRDMD